MIVSTDKNVKVDLHIQNAFNLWVSSHGIKTFHFYPIFV